MNGSGYRRKKRSRVLIVVVLVLLALLLAAGAALLLRSVGEEEKPPASVSSTQTGTSSASGEQTSLPESESDQPNSGQEVVPAGVGSISGLTEDQKLADWRLVLINPWNKVEQEPEFEKATVGGYLVDARIADALQRMLDDAKAAGTPLQIISGFRTMERSEKLYREEVQAWVNLGYSQEDALVEAAARVAPPGTSEHHSGLAVDIFTAGWVGGFVDAFEDDPGGRWLHQHCAEYGFILRFPKNKTEITGIDYEPWHFRYVGEEYAAVIMEQGICLEEFLEN